MNYKTSLTIYNVCLAAAIIVCLFGMMIETGWLAFVGIGLLLGGMIQAMIFYRCPSCGEMFSLRDRKPKFCPRCGFDLEYWED